VAGLQGVSAGDPAWFAGIFGMAPDRGWYAVRVNMELFDPDNSAWSLFGDPVNNIQSFLVVDGWPFLAARGATTGSTSTSAVLANEETTEQRRRTLQDQGRQLRRQR
jgi:hypothetical protein